MAKRLRKPPRPVTPGVRVGTKRRDMRWQAEGQEWDSRLEYEVFRVYRDAGYNIRRCTAEDSVRYTRPVRNGVCNACGAVSVDSVHSYTADFFVFAGPKAEGGQSAAADAAVASAGHYLEVKGYLRADRRSLLRALRKARPDVDLRLIAQRDYRVTKTATLTQWARRYLRCPAILWNGGVPDWSDSLPTAADKGSKK